MNTIHFNRIGLNTVSLNNVGGGMRKSAQGGSTDDVPAGYDIFMASDGDFLAADGELYVKS